MAPRTGIEELRIANLGVIADAVLPLGPGLTVVTGETGAGKTMVLTGLLLLFGGRADAARVRSGAEHATVEGRVLLDPDGPGAARARDAGGELDDDGSLVLRRVVSSTGRSRAQIGGAAAPVGVLGELADRLIAVHGQADQLRLTRPGQQRATLDRYAGIDLAPYQEAFERWRNADAALADRTARARELQREADVLAHGIAEIEAAAPEPGEDDALSALASRLAHADSLRLAARIAHDALLGDPDDPAGDAADVASLLGTARRAVQQQSGDDPELDKLGSQLNDLLAGALDLGSEFGAYAEQLDADPERLAEVEGRRAVLGTLTRKYGADVDAVLRWADEARARLADLDVSDEALARLAAARDAVAAEAADHAARIRAERTDAAQRLAQAVTAELAGLAMGAARLEVEVRGRAAVSGGPVLVVDGMASGAGHDGTDEVELLLRPAASLPAVPIGKGASGGELSRVMLALEVCLAGTDPVPTMVFDEVDAGVGGRAAVEVGRRLARLAKAHQVIVVTHLAQVAAFADRHVVVDRSTEVTSSSVQVVAGEERVAELARMLAGADSATAREHAAELLANAQADRA